MSDGVLDNTRKAFHLAGLVLLALVVVLTFFTASLLDPPYLRTVRLECPYCNETSSFGITRHNPAGVSHLELPYCPKCYRSFVVIVYYDGELVVMKQ